MRIYIIEIPETAFETGRIMQPDIRRLTIEMTDGLVHQIDAYKAKFSSVYTRTTLE